MILLAPALRGDLAVDFSPVPNIEDSNLLGDIVNPVQNTVVSDSNPPSLPELASEEFYSRRTRILRQRSDGLVDFLDDKLGQFLKLLRCPSVD